MMYLIKLIYETDDINVRWFAFKPHTFQSRKHSKDIVKYHCIIQSGVSMYAVSKKINNNNPFTLEYVLMLTFP